MPFADQILCRGLEVECEIGIRDSEQGVKQKLVIDFTAKVEPARSDRAEEIRLDYSVAAPAITRMVSSRKFFLIEAVAEAVAAYLLQSPGVMGVEVGVTKFPKDLPNVASVACVCRRSRAS